MNEKNKTEKITIRIEKEIKKKLEEKAKKEDLPISYIVRQALKEYLKNWK